MFNQRLVNTFVYERVNNIRSGVYGFTQIEFAYNSSKIERNRLTKEQVSKVFGNELRVDQINWSSEDVKFTRNDFDEVVGHLLMFSHMLDTLGLLLSEDLIKSFHKSLKCMGFVDVANGYAIGDYKTRRNYVGDIETALPAEVPERMSKLLSQYWVCEKSLENLARFHAEYEKIHPFQDGNGRTGGIILFRECLVHGITPFIIRDVNKARYINALVKAQNGDASALVKYFTEEQEWYKSKVGGSLLG